MTDSVATACSTCGSPVAPAAPFCAACGSPAVAFGAPAAARPLSGPAVPAGLGRRFAAYLIDSVLLGLGTTIVLAVVTWVLVAGAMASGSYSAYLTITTVVNVVQLLVWAAVLLLLAALLGRGAGPGMRMLGLRLQRLEGGDPGFGAALGRQLLLGLSSLIIVGPLSPLFDSSGRRQGWHDRATNTWVVDVRPGAQPMAQRAPAAPVTAQERARWEAPEQPIASAFAETAFPPVVQKPLAAEPAPALQAAPFTAPLRTAPAAAAGLITTMPDFGAPAAADREEAGERDDVDLTRAATARTPALRIGGSRYPMGGTALVGRDPAARAGERVDDLIAPPDPGRSMSKTHALIELDADGTVWVTDRRSTNGTRLIVHGAEQELAPAQRTPVPRGASIVFGDLTATVELP